MNPLRPLGPLLLMTLLALGGCNGTTFGRRLANSFDPPAAGTPAGSPTAPPAGAGTPAATNAAGAAAGEPTRPGTGGATPAPTGPAGAPGSTPAATTAAANVAAAKAEAAKTAEVKAGAAKTMAPLPYRVTLRLPAADPSAPAEAVTEALRAAGISFEVETIERIRSAATPAPAAAPATTPAPAPR